MSKLGCPCGATIRNTSDNLPYKAFFQVDMEREEIFSNIENIVSNYSKHLAENGPGAWSKTHGYPTNIGVREQLLVTDHIDFSVIGRSRTLYECEVCGRIAVEMSENSFIFYHPDNEQVNRPFDRSAKATS
jgi:hypothetical protein